jgi:hypothetical protein
VKTNTSTFNNVLNAIIQTVKWISKWVPRIISIGIAFVVLLDIIRIFQDRYILYNKDQFIIFVMFIIPSIGLFIGWRNEAIGGIIAIIGFIIYIYFIYSLPIEGSQRADGIGLLIYFLFPIFCVPGLLLLLSSKLSKFNIYSLNKYSYNNYLLAY